MYYILIWYVYNTKTVFVCENRQLLCNIWTCKITCIQRHIISKEFLWVSKYSVQIYCNFDKLCTDEQSENSHHDCLSVEGVELMKVFKEELDKFEAERQELANAERLFDLPITMYPELLSVQKEMKGLEMIYDLYVTQKVGTHEGTRDDL